MYTKHVDISVAWHRVISVWRTSLVDYFSLRKENKI